MFQVNLEVHITTWRSENGSLFDYKTEDYEEMRQFKAVVYNVVVSSNHPTAYLFFHQPVHTEQKHMVLLEQRKSLLSRVDTSDSKKNSQSKPSLSHTLLCGVEVSFRPGCRDPYVRAIPAQEVPVDEPYGHFAEERSSLKPFWVVRSFPKGFRLKVGQHLQLGRQEFRIEEVNLSGMNGEQHYKEEEILDLDQKVDQSRS